MSSVSESTELELALRSGQGRSSWIDPSGIRGIVRHRLARGAAAVLAAAAVVGLIAGVGNPLPLVAIAVLVSIQALLAPVDPESGRVRGSPAGIRLGILGWPIALTVLAATGWSSAQDLNVVVAVAGFAIAMFVALTERRDVAVVWTLATAFLVGFGTLWSGAPAFDTIVLSAVIGVGALTGDRIRETLEAFLGARRRLMRDVSRLPVSQDPFVTAELLLRPLVRWTPLTSIAITWFQQDGRAMILGAAGDGLPAVIAAGKELPEGRAREMRAQAQHGPWISGWTVRSDDSGYSKTVAAAGIKAAVYVPLVFEGRVIGTVGAGLTDRGDDRSAMAEYVPTLVQFADAAALELGPSLAKRDLDSVGQHAIDEILERRLYSPVFQSVRRLTDGRIVGYEALTRFNSALTTPQVFSQARTTGRMRDLEIATLRAAVDAAAALPADCWLSVNSSPNLLVEPDTLAEILAPVQRQVVIELSEHDAIEDYAPIAAAFGRLGPGRHLAVDDAGAGFASLRHILEVRPAFVKLDIGLVQGLAVDMARTALVAGFVRFATDAGFTLIAEGIETDADRRALRRLGVELGQGFLLGRPQPARKVISSARPAHGVVARRRPTVDATIGVRAPQPG
jgi:EAL domain-containing protein (putative c-di-GMP-specific phosphodiesterase class I)